MKRIILIDGNSLMYRAYYGMAANGNLTQNSKGMYTNAIYAFARMINHLLKTEYDNILVAFDAGKKTFRHELMSDYKGGRSPMPDEMRMQIPLIKEYLDIMRIKQYELSLYEADDIIGTMAKMASDNDYSVDIYSSDKDLLQLIGKNTTVHLTKKGLTDLEDFNPEYFLNKYEINYSNFIDLKALMGDKSDNISGVPGIGEKKAVKLIQTYGTIENMIENKDSIAGSDGVKIRENSDLALLCKKMVTINCDSPIAVTLSDTERHSPDNDKLISFYQELEFKSLLKEMSLNNVVEIPKANYKVVESNEELKSILLPYSSLIFESIGSNYHKAPLLTIAIKNKMGSYIIPISYLHDSVELKAYLEEENSKSVFDYKKSFVLLKRFGINLIGVDFDLLLACYIANPTIAKEDMKTICSFYKYNDISFDEEIYGKGAKEQIPSDESIVWNHAIRKVNALFLIKKEVLNTLEENNQLDLLSKIEIPLAKVLGKMEYEGMTIDLEELDRQEASLNLKIKDLEKQIYECAGMEFNISSPKQLGEVLFERLGLECNKKTKSGYSTDIDVLEFLKDKNPIVPLIIDYRQLTKLNSTYVAGMRENIFPDSKVHTIYCQALTETGRLSSIEPNLQNIPIRTEEGHQIRKMFIPSVKGNTFFSADYSQIELRVLAHMGRVKNLIQAFRDGNDIHTETAKAIFGHSDITSLERRKAKAVNFGIVYGISAFGLASDINISNYEAKLFIEKYYEHYPEIKEYMNETIEFCKEFGYVKTIKNRHRYIPNINSKIYLQREFAKRTAMNAPIQGSAADILKMAMVDIDKKLTSNNLKSKMLVTVHDELVFEVYKGEEDIISKLVTESMENVVSLDVPLLVDSSFGNNWYEVK